MNYEDLYSDLQPQKKDVKDALSQLTKLNKAIEKEMDSGDIKSLSRDLSAMGDVVSVLCSVLEEFSGAVSGFDTKAYFESGDFETQMLACCEEKGVDVRGDSPVYEMFPYKVRVDIENQDVYLDRKRIQCMRPASFVNTVKAGQEKLNKANFNENTFAAELADAYELAILKKKRQPQADLYLLDLYAFLAPMSRFRKDYDQQSFAFDLARLYISGITETKNGRKFQFGTTRNAKKSIRILDANGKEEYLSTIRFYKEEE